MGREKATSQPTTKPYGWNRNLICSNCKRSPAKKTGRCDLCYNYHNRTGVERPESAWLKPPRMKQPKWCKNCGRMDVVAHGRCNACRQYYDTHGKERPKHLYKVDQERRCKNCKVPLASLGKKPSGQNRFTRGQCDPCYRYKQRTGKPRPKHLWGIGKYGWCSCGYPANYQKDGFDLCSRCAEV